MKYKNIQLNNSVQVILPIIDIILQGMKSCRMMLNTNP